MRKVHLFRPVLTVVACLILTSPAMACLTGEYAHLSRQCSEVSPVRSLLNVAFGELTQPRQIAVVAGVSQYPNLLADEQLPPSDYDVETLANLLAGRLGFEEVIVLKNEDFSYANLRYLFSIYLPSQLSANKKARVVFTFSGHGAEYKDLGYIFYSSTKTIDPISYEDTTDAIELSLLKQLFLPTMAEAQHFLALINSCNGGHFLADTAYIYGSGSLEQRGAHGITAGGAGDKVRALPNVGDGKGSVFFEMVFAALTGKNVRLRDEEIQAPAKDGILSVSELTGFLKSTIEKIENYEIRPVEGSLVPVKAGAQGEFYFITDVEKAKASLRERFPERAALIFGPATPQRPLTVFEAGFVAPSPAITADIPDLIRPQSMLADGVRLVPNAEWERKTLVRSSGLSAKELHAPRAKAIGDDVFVPYIAFDRQSLSSGGTVEVLEYDVTSGKTFKIDEAEVQNYCFTQGNNMQIVGEDLYYFMSCDRSARVYRLGSKKAPADAPDYSFEEENAGFSVARSPDGRYIVANYIFYAGEYFETAPEAFKIAVGSECLAECQGTGVVLYDDRLHERTLLFEEEYAGDWSIGGLIWSADGSRFFFDNSGPVACIWEYDLGARELRKIVPEHAAKHPFYFSYKGRDHILYTETIAGSSLDAYTIKIARTP